MGVTSKPALLAKLDGITEDQARDLLRQYELDNAEFSATPGVPMPGATMPAQGDQDEDAAVIPGGVEKAQDTALNGAHVVAAQEIVQAVALGQLPRDAGIQMLSAFFNLPLATAAKVMGSVGRGFKVRTEDQP